MCLNLYLKLFKRSSVIKSLYFMDRLLSSMGQSFELLFGLWLTVAGWPLAFIFFVLGGARERSSYQTIYRQHQSP